MQLHWHILDKKRKAILPLLKKISADGFYLAGGTGLALQLGHRDSVDFDFFKKEDFDTRALKEKLEQVFKGHQIFISQEERNTLSCEIDNEIHLSFLGYPYELQKPLIRNEHFDIASIEDIACMKISAIESRAVERDYVDLYFILQKISLDDLFGWCEKKYPPFNRMVALKSLSFYDDVLRWKLVFKEGHKVSWGKVKKYLQESVQVYMRKKTLEFTRQKKQGRDIER